MEILIQPVTAKNLGDVPKVQKDSYSHIPTVLETKETFGKMAAAFPDGCRLVYCGKQPVGYIFFHPFFESKPKSLNYIELQLTGKENCMYLHDIAVVSSMRNKGLAKMLLDYFEKVTRERGFKSQYLVAVKGSWEFWQKQGFIEVKDIENYGGVPAKYLRKVLG